ncbi:hypothetical protein KC356_g125 [Hortaea werneckii]|nr:hypothetical protein KC356_g125 [Hortaea werneckii]
MAYLFLLFFSSFFGSPSLLSFSVFSDVPFNISFSSLSISCFLSASSLPLASSVFSERPPEIPTEPSAEVGQEVEDVLYLPIKGASCDIPNVS